MCFSGTYDGRLSMKLGTHRDSLRRATVLGASAFFAVVTGALWIGSVLRSRAVTKPPAVVLLFAALVVRASISIL